MHWAFFSLTLSLLTGAGRSLIAARLIGVREMGAVGIALLAFATVEALTASATAETALVSHPGDPEEDLDSAFTVRVAQGIVMAALLWVSARTVGRFFQTPDVSALVQALALVPLIRSVSNPAAILLVRRIEFRRLFWWSLPEAAVGVALVIAIGLLRHDAWALVAALIGSQIVSTAVSYCMVPRIPRFALARPALDRLLHYGRWMQLTRVLMFIALYLDNLLVGKLLGAPALGIYQVAFRVSEIPVVTMGRAAEQVLLPVLSRLQDRPRRLMQEYLDTLRLVLTVNAAFALAIVLVGGPLIGVLLGAEWLPAVPVIRILAIAMLFRAVMTMTSQLFYAIGRPREVFAVNLVRVAALALTIYPLLRVFSTAGVAISVLVSCLAGAALCAAKTRAYLKSAAY